MSNFIKKTLFLLGTVMAVLFFGIQNVRAQSSPKFKVIAFYSQSYDVAHISFSHEANGWFAQIAEKYNFQYDSTKNWDNLNANFLSQYQVVMFLDDLPSSASQRAAFQQYMQNGGGFMGFHVCAFNTDPSSWDWYHNQFLATGAFRTNTWGPTSAVLKVEDKTYPATVGMPDKFTSAVSEWYGWNKDLRTNPNIKILCSVDPSSFPLGSDPNQSWYSGYYPIVWTNKNYKMMYCNFGHNDIDYAHNNATKSRTFSVPVQNQMVINGLLNIGGGAAPVFEIPGTVQAEGYDVMSGVHKETTTDVGGGQNIGYIDAGDWMDYKVNVKTSGSYTLQYRVASMNGGGSIQLKSGNNVLATTSIPTTSAWQTWATVNATVNLTAGTQTIRLQAVTGGFNLNWIKFTPEGPQNIAPTVSLTAPSANTEFTSPASINIAANAADVDGTISKVEFFNGSTLLGTSTTQPYSFNWNNVGVGSYTITAKATDNLGASTTSAAVGISVKSTTPTCQPAVASADDGNVAANVLDNNLATRWSANGDGQWIQFCLDSVQSLYGLQIAFYNGNQRQSIFDILISNDGNNWTNVLSGVRSSGTSLNLETFTFATQTAKYVRVLGHGNSLNTWNSFTEVKILLGTAPMNHPPVVSIASPVNNATFTAPASINITANASDISDGIVTKVEFFRDSIKVGEDLTSPYSFTLTNVGAGTYSLTAKATDNGGASTISSPVSVTVNQAPPNVPPSVNITSPANNTSFTAPASISINANAADSDGSVVKVEFFNGSTKLGEDVVSPYSFNWTNVAAGNYSITAKATDNKGASTVSTAIAITVKANTNACSGLPTYTENGGYAAGSKVQNAGGIYQCKPYPYSGWCNGSAWAYAPGTGSYWSDAWDKVGSCNSARATSSAPETNLIGVYPNPASQSVQVKLNVENITSAEYTVINSLGVEVSKGILNSSLEGTIDLNGMKNGIYTIRINAEGNVWSNKVVVSNE